MYRALIAATFAALAAATGAAEATAQTRSAATIERIGSVTIQAGDPERKARQACGGNATTSTQLYNRLGAPIGERISCSRGGKTYYIEVSGGTVTAVWSS